MRWLQLLLATVFAREHAPFRATRARRFPGDRDRSRAAPSGRSRANDFAPTQVMKRTEHVVDSRWMYAGAGVEVSEEDLETLPAELREALVGDRQRARRRGENAAAT